MLKQSIALLVALLVGVAVFVGVESYSSSFQGCMNEESAKAASNERNNQNNSVAVVVRSYAVCTERFADRHNAFITALATILLAVITLGLTLSGIDQQKTTRAELRGYLSMNPKIVSNFGTTTIINIEFLSKNHGQTPAFNISHAFRIDVLPNPLPS